MPQTKRPAESLSTDIHLLGDLLGQVIRSQAGVELFELEERIRALAKARRVDPNPEIEAALAQRLEALTPDQVEDVARAFTSYFELVNLAEEAHRVRVLRARARDAHPRPLPISIAAAVETLWERGVDAYEMAQLLDDLHIELVFTAHPTEAKRRSVLSKLRRIGQRLHDLEVRDLLPTERRQVINQIHAEITALWVTERSRTNQLLGLSLARVAAIPPENRKVHATPAAIMRILIRKAPGKSMSVESRPELLPSALNISVQTVL